MAKKNGVMKEQGFRYNKETWTKAAAHNHCISHSGTFEGITGEMDMPKSFKIVDGDISKKPWDADSEESLWQTIQDGIGNDVTGIKGVMMEMYALVSESVMLEDSECKLPHHEIRQDGTMVLNRDGAVRAAEMLDSIPEPQRNTAKLHLQRHFRDLKETFPKKGETIVRGEIELPIGTIGEISVSDIPISAAVDIEKLKEGDTDPLELVVSIPASTSKKGWNYKSEAIRDIVDVVNREGLPGYEGHQNPDNVNWEYRDPMTHWIGAKFENGVGYFRGLIDSSAAKLKRMIKGKTIKTVSIFGTPKIIQSKGVVDVVGYNPISIDWTPPRRAGMQTTIVAMGEMIVVKKDIEIPNSEEESMDIVGVKTEELLAEIKQRLSDGRISLQAVGEMAGIDLDAPQKIDTATKLAETATNTLAKVREALGVNSEMDVITVATEAKTAMDNKKEADYKLVVDKVFGEMKVDDKIRPLVVRMMKSEHGATEDIVKGEIKSILDDPSIQNVYDYRDTSVPISNVEGRKNKLPRRMVSF